MGARAKPSSFRHHVHLYIYMQESIVKLFEKKGSDRETLNEVLTMTLSLEVLTMKGGRRRNKEEKLMKLNSKVLTWK